VRVRVSVRRVMAILAMGPAIAVIEAAPATAAGPHRPVVSSISPKVVSASGNTRIIVVGRHFAGVKAVRFGSARGRQVRVSSSRKLSVLTPRRSAGAVQVRVAGRGGVSARRPQNRIAFVRLAPLRGVQASAIKGGVKLAWREPTSDAATAVIIRRAIGHYPAGPTAGTAVPHAGVGGSSTDRSVKPSTTYDYAIFVRYGPHLVSRAARAHIATAKSPGPSKPPKPPDSPKTYTARLWLALVITLAAFLLVALLRRFAAARNAHCSLQVAVLFALTGRGEAPAVAPAGPAPALAGTPGPPGGPPAGADPAASGIQAPRGLLIGGDNRTSTSKATALLWTAVLLYFLVTLTLIFATHPDRYAGLIHRISPLYLVLLGGPFAAAVLANGIVGGAVDSRTMQKSTAAKPRVADVFSDDDGNTDLVDTQYILFNLLVAATVIAQFVHAPGSGAPQIPDFLAVLTGVSAATYLANKGATVSKNLPTIDRVLPGSILATVGGSVTVLGSNFVVQGDTTSPRVYINDAIEATVGTVAANSLHVAIPAGQPRGHATITVRTPSGAVVTASDKLRLT
jgi:hypothetical protein